MLSFCCIKGIEYFFRIKRKFPSDEFDFSSEGNSFEGKKALYAWIFPDEIAG